MQVLDNKALAFLLLLRKRVFWENISEITNH